MSARQATAREAADYLAGHVSGEGYRETEHGLEVDAALTLTAPASWPGGRYTRPELVEDVKVTPSRFHHGYGAKVPTRYLVRYAGRWRRVYVMIYGSGGSPYVVVGGAVAHLDTDTEHRVSEAAA